jgi:serine/threonine protein kinase/Flp pilus assembly protein TadD
VSNATGPTLPADDAGASPSAFPQLGTRYRIEKELGRGGMGRVFAARDLKLSRDVAIKIVARSAPEAEALRRFEQEARAAASLDHPNIIAIYDIGEHESGPFIVSELLRGSTLRGRMAAGRLPLPEVMDYSVQIARGLCAAHAKGVIHRDLKPENLFVTNDGRVKILDFGIAKLMAPPQDAPSASSPATETGAILGTVGYMSPEQVRGKPADHRSDFFSFGVILYEMLSGQSAFRRKTALETACAILEDEPPELPREVPPDLAGIVRRCLRKDPDERFASAQDLLDALASAGAARAPPRRLRSIAVIGAAILAALATAVIARRTMRGGDAAGIQKLAVLPLSNLSRDPDQEYFVDGMTDTLIAELGQLSGLRVISRTSSMRYKNTAKPLPQVADELAVDAVVEGSVERSGNAIRMTVQLINARTDTHLWARSYTRDMRDVLSLQDELARAVAAEIRLRLTPHERALFERARSVNPEAYEAYLKGLHYWNAHTGEAMRKAIAEYERAIRLDPAYALARVALSDAYHIFPFNADVPPEDFFPRARQSALEALKADPQLSEAHGSLAFILALHDWDWAGAEREYREAIALNPSNSAARAFYAMTLSLQGKHDEAIAEGLRAKELDPVSPTVGLHLGRIYFFAGQPGRATQLFLNAIEVNPEFWPLHLFLGHVYEQQGLFPQALLELQKAQGPSLAATASIGHLHAVAGKRAEAAKILDELVARSRAGYLPPSYIARIHTGLGDHDQAISWLDRALAAHDAHLALVGAEPAFGPLRADPRFLSLLRRLNLAPP